MSLPEDLERWLDTVPEKVRKNVEIVAKGSNASGQYSGDYFLHISTNTNIKKFTPIIGHRQAKSEDRSVPRITVAPTLLGCLIGYAKAEWDFQQLKPNGKGAEEKLYKGGWAVYAIPYEYALKPNDRLVYDAHNSDEHWLVSFDKETNEYIPEMAAKMFYRSLRLVGRGDKLPAGEIELYIEVTRPSGISFSKHYYLKTGCYLITGPTQNHVETWRDDSEYEIQSIDKQTYLSAKKATADLLSLEDKAPASIRWCKT